MFVSEVLPAVSAGVQALAQVNVPMLPHVVHCGVVLATAGIQNIGLIPLVKSANSTKAAL